MHETKAIGADEFEPNLQINLRICMAIKLFLLF
jgi:hypothetical protein